jgi:hypothetical protein
MCETNKNKGEQFIASREREDKEYFSKDRIFEGERIEMEH